jgi:type II secretory ATPase GspE/PulE/Tfp pilus assembly ATPase PilB-like protein
MRLNDGKRKINTIEDPVEYAIDGLRQSQVNPSISLGFRELLRSVLRQSPDVIMIGEIRDEETRAHRRPRGQQRHPRLRDAARAVRIVGRSINARAGVHTHFLASGLRGVVAQRLVRHAVSQVQSLVSTSRTRRTRSMTCARGSAPTRGRPCSPRAGARRAT